MMQGFLWTTGSDSLTMAVMQFIDHPFWHGSLTAI